jgi:hypothetical protein
MTAVARRRAAGAYDNWHLTGASNHKRTGESAMLNQDRRELIGKSLALAGTAGLLTSSLAGVAHAQTLGPMRRSNRYEDSFIFERKP